MRHRCNSDSCLLDISQDMLASWIIFLYTHYAFNAEYLAGFWQYVATVTVGCIPREMFSACGHTMDEVNVVKELCLINLRQLLSVLYPECAVHRLIFHHSNTKIPLIYANISFFRTLLRGTLRLHRPTICHQIIFKQ